MYKYFGKVNIVIRYTMQHFDTSDRLNIKSLQIHVQYLHIILTLDLVSGA